MCIYYFRHLVEYVDGKLKFTNAQGPLGKQLSGLNECVTPLVKFQTIETNVPDPLPGSKV